MNLKIRVFERPLFKVADTNVINYSPQVNAYELDKLNTAVAEHW